MSTTERGMLKITKTDSIGCPLALINHANSYQGHKFVNLKGFRSHKHSISSEPTVQHRSCVVQKVSASSLARTPVMRLFVVGLPFSALCALFKSFYQS